MKIRTSELIGNALDWAVAKCDNPEWSDEDAIVNVTTLDEYDGTICNYSTDWAQGGPIIERECMLLDYDGIEEWEGRIVGIWMEYGPTPLIAAMRCYVGSKLGNEVEVPDELTKKVGSNA